MDLNRRISSLHLRFQNESIVRKTFLLLCRVMLFLIKPRIDLVQNADREKRQYNECDELACISSHTRYGQWSCPTTLRYPGFGSFGFILEASNLISRFGHSSQFAFFLRRISDLQAADKSYP